MEKKDFARLENMCQLTFMEAGTCFHVCSREDHPLLFHNDEEFKVAMNVVAFCAFMYPDIEIFTFAVMNNHFHFAASGELDRVKLFRKTLILKMASHPALKGSSQDIKALQFKEFPINSIDNMRNVIAYINRNGFVVCPDHSPFSYPWGANRYYYSPEARQRFQENGSFATYRQKREIFHSGLLADNGNIIMLDGYISPACYCTISKGESLFRSCWHYFQSVARNIESSKDIAKSIGENIFYNDEDLFTLVRTTCSKKYGKQSIQLITNDEKVEMARMLHYDYNASNKQVARILKMEVNLVNTLFPNTRS